MGLRAKLQKSINEQWCMRFKTQHPDGDKFDGVVTQIEHDFIVLREIADFEFDGAIVFPKKGITGYRDGKYDTCCNHILRQNGAIDQLSAPSWLKNCSTIPDVLSEIARRDIWPGVEALLDNGTDSALYIGPILEVGATSFKLESYDAAGGWENVYELEYDDVFKIELDSRYCNHFNAYMRTIAR